MTDLEKATNELINALDLIKGNKAFDKKLVIETALKKYADSEVKKLNIPAVMKSVCDHKAPRRIVFGEHRCSKCGMLIGHN